MKADRKITPLTLDETTLPVIEQIADQMPGGFFIYHADGDEKLIFVNKGLLEIFGCDDTDQFYSLTNSSFKGMVHPDDLQKVEKSILDQIATSPDDRDYVEYRIIRRDGSIRYIEDYGHYAETRDYGGVYYVFVNDITEKHIAEELEKQQKLNRFKLDFLFNISHDIRTPMNSIMGFTALAKCHLDDPDLLEDYLDKVDISNRRMMSLIDDILEMSSLESGSVTIHSEACSIAGLVESVINDQQPAAKKKNITLRSESGLKHTNICVDTVRFSRILSNVIGNAVKFTPPGGHITVKAQETGDTVSGYERFIFTITDDGIGMTDEFMNRIFLPFEREETSTRSGHYGSGLGLSIAKSLLNMMGGSITVKSRKGEGSEFVISLPLRLAREEDYKRSTPTNRDDRVSRRILVVDDIEINTRLAETVLRRNGYEVECVSDGCEAVDAVKDHPENYYDLVLMDIQMPVMNGYEATRAIRAIHRRDTAHLPIIALSVNAGAEDRRMSVESGMNAHVAKPFEIRHLVETVKFYLNDE